MATRPPAHHSLRRILESKNQGPLTLGQLIESIRLCDNDSQVSFARKLGISRSHLCDIEKGRKSLSAERAARFAEILGYAPEYFVQVALEDQIQKSKLKLRISVSAA